MQLLPDPNRAAADVVDSYSGVQPQGATMPACPVSSLTRYQTPPVELRPACACSGRRAGLYHPADLRPELVQPSTSQGRHSHSRSRSGGSRGEDGITRTHSAHAVQPSRPKQADSDYRSSSWHTGGFSLALPTVECPSMACLRVFAALSPLSAWAAGMVCMKRAGMRSRISDCLFCHSSPAPSPVCTHADMPSHACDGVQQNRPHPAAPQEAST